MEPERNLWQATAGAPVETSALEGQAAADVVVLGGGFTGLSAALHLAEAGVDVRLLEAHEIGHGGSGRNVGLVNAGLWTPPDEIEAILGRDAGSRLNAALAEGPALVFGLIERHGISCERTRTGTLHLAHSPAGLRDLERRRDQQARRGAPVSLLDAEETASRTGSRRYYGALHDARAGTIQPLAYARGLARAAQRAGARLHQGAPALRVHRERGLWAVETPSGRLVARRLLRATNAYSEALPPPSFTPVHYLQFATSPLSPDQLKVILPGREGCWDTAAVMSSVRLDAAGRLILGGVGSLDGVGRGLHFAWAKRKLRALYPDLGDVDLEFGWHGRIAMTGSHLPRIERTGSDAVSIYGYSGRGIAPGAVFGKAAAEWARTGAEEAFPLPLCTAMKERFLSIRAAYYEFGGIAAHVVDARSARGKPRTRQA